MVPVTKLALANFDDKAGPSLKPKTHTPSTPNGITLLHKQTTTTSEVGAEHATDCVAVLVEGSPNISLTVDLAADPGSLLKSASMSLVAEEAVGEGSSGSSKGSDTEAGSHCQ